jgi:signal transduction histidine kinase/ActR/RegA family two-component response regulator
MAKWSVKRTLSSGLIVIGLLAILSSGASLFASRFLVQNMATLALHEVNDLADSRSLQLIGYQEVSNASAALLTGDSQHARAARAASASLRERMSRSGAQIVDGDGRSHIERIRLAERDYLDAFERALGVSPGPQRLAANAAVAARGVMLEQALSAFVAHMEPAAVGGLEATRASVNRTQTTFNLITSVSITLMVILCVMLILVINRGQREQASERLRADEGRRRSTAALDEAKARIQIKDQFLATVSHELRNPLAPLLTWTQLLRSGKLDKEKADRGLEVIERSVVSLSKLIDDLVDASRVVSGKFRLDVRPIDLAPVIKAAAEAQRPAIDAKQIRLSLVLDERAGRISGDSERLQQVIGNLLSNAIKFTPKHGRIQISLGRAESHLSIVVSDTGIGIGAEFLPHIFEPFHQERDGSKRRHGGLGLGLSIVHQIVELHGGEIVAQSRGPGEGSTFTIKLPLLASSEPNGLPGPRHPEATDGPANVRLGRLDKIRVLLVDDEPQANEAIQTLLDSCGAETRVAGSAAQALQVLDVWRPDVLISDIAMPEEDGYALIRSIRARSASQNGDIPAAALTAYAKPEDRVSILAAGFQMYLAKPADPGELIAVVASLAVRPRRFPARTPNPQ